MTAFYLDTSVAVRALLMHSVAAAAWLDETTSNDVHTVFSSRLMRTELTRVLRREGLPATTRDQILDGISLAPLTDGVLAEAEAIVPQVKTLDAIHLATVIASGLDATIVTHDAGMAAAAEVIGYPVLDPITD